MDHPAILHIETSGNFCSVALSAGTEILSFRHSKEKYDHSETLAPFISEVLGETSLKPTKLTAIALSRGPGSYTGLRVGTSVAKAMCYVLGCRLIAIDTLESIALACIHTSGRTEGICYPVLDARRKEVYTAAFDSDGERLLSNMAVEIADNTFERLTEVGERVVICGPAAAKCGALATSSEMEIQVMQPDAKYLLLPALRAWRTERFADPAAFKPEYIKPPNITKTVRPPF